MPVVADSPSAVQDSEPTVVATAPIQQPTESVELAVPVSGRHYVVMGVFQTQENAANAQKFFARRAADLDYAIYRLGNRYMVSCYVSEHEMKARDFLREHRDTFSELWVYSAR